MVAEGNRCGEGVGNVTRIDAIGARIGRALAALVPASAAERLRLHFAARETRPRGAANARGPWPRGNLDMAIYGRTGQVVTILRVGTLEDVKKLDGRRPDKQDKHNVKYGGYVVVL